MSMKGRDGRPEETFSESNSDCTAGRGSSIGSLAREEDLQEVALSLGLTSTELLVQDRFKIDRKRLENLIFGSDPDSAAKFFDSVMDETKTKIAWPSKLKQNASSRKDPHIRITGRAEDVNTAKEKVIALFDTKRNRVNMKIDVSYTEHSHIIGKGGLTIKKVMADTACHIHFPDSNRNNPNEKSNQVSIAGNVEGVEKARAKVREMTPLTFCFDLPILGALALPPDPLSPFIRNIQTEYHVQVLFRTRQKLNSNLVVVRGCEWEVDLVKEATQLLINHMCQSVAKQVPVHMMVEISPQHHNIVLGKKNENLKTIMENTHTQIVFLDPNDPNIPSLKKSNVTITGSINNVYLARQQLIGSLPILLMFDVPENTVTSDQSKLKDIMTELDVLITLRPKPKQNLVTYFVKGIERNVGNVYEARRRMIESEEPVVTADIPQTYFIPNAGPVFSSSWNYGSPLGGTSYVDSMPSPVMQSPALIFGSVPTLTRPSQPPDLSPLGEPVVSALWDGQGAPVHPRFHPGHHMIPHYLYHQLLQRAIPQQAQKLIHLPSTNGSTQSSRPGLHPQYQQELGGYSYSSLSLPDLQNVATSLSSNGSSISSPSVSPRTASPVPQPSSQIKLNCTGSSFNSAHKEENSSLHLRKAPGFERPVLEPAELQKMKLQAVQAMQKAPVPGELRAPTSAWSGLGFSQSSPSAALREMSSKEDLRLTGKDSAGRSYGLWGAGSMAENIVEENNSGVKSNILESVTESTTNLLRSMLPSVITDLRSILATVGLEKYAILFEQHEIDLATFVTLNDKDLREMGVNAFGARRKIMLCITELNQRTSTTTIMFNGSTAPGAERSTSASNSSLNELW